MAVLCSLFRQILNTISRGQFEQLAKAHRSERHARGFTSWQQFVAMMFCHLGGARSLREIEHGLRSAAGKLNHLGIKVPNRSTLAYANAHRPWQLFESVFYALLEQCREVATGPRRFRFKNKLLSIDSTTVELVAEMFSWAQYGKTKGAIKLHLMLDHDGFLPTFAVVSDGQSADITVGRQMSFPPGAIVVFDRGYVDYEWFKTLDAQGVFFVTRLKKNCTYVVIEERVAPRGVLKDQVVEVSNVNKARNKDYVPVRLRRIEVEVPGKEANLVFFSNHFTLGATTISRIYKDRWQIELFFKALKQNLKIKTFIGTSANALHIQLWTALIAMLLVRYLNLKASSGVSLSNLFAMLHFHLFSYCDLWEWLRKPFEPLESPPQQLVLV
jgi:hypothetical protein